jgi:ribosomal-protein-alanine N-acetyltransferase
MKNEVPTLITDRCIMKSITMNDLNEIHQIYSNKEVMDFMQRPPMKCIKEAESLILKWHNMLTEKNGFRWGVFLKSNPNKLIGTIALHYWNKNSNSIELGADLAKEYWNQGLAYEFTKPAIDFAFNELNINRIELRCHPKNIASTKIAKKFGFTYEGTLREYVFVEGNGYVDESVYSMLKYEYCKLSSEN